jgi:hypothetical protein
MKTMAKIEDLFFMQENWVRDFLCCETGIHLLSNASPQRVAKESDCRPRRQGIV